MRALGFEIFSTNGETFWKGVGNLRWKIEIERNKASGKTPGGVSVQWEW
jgi:hypothetical protein